MEGLFVLKRIREIKGLSRAALANKAGLSPRTIEAFELGLRHPSRAALKRLAEALGVSVDILTGQEGAALILTRIQAIGETEDG